MPLSTPTGGLPTAEQLLSAAKEIAPDLAACRRALHRHPEVGRSLPFTAQYVETALLELGCAPQRLCESGVTATISGQDTGRCILLRADMDALAVREETDLPFRAENGAMHACGHDMHTAMLLGAARLLTRYRAALPGTIKLVFQPDEEGLTGAKAMLAAGILSDPAPQAGLALHVGSGTPTGLVACNSGMFMAGSTLFRITVSGKGCHGAYPEGGVDPIVIASHICLALQEITGRELPAQAPAVLTVGHFHAGQAPNVIPGSAVLEGSIRTFDQSLSAFILRRIEELSRSIAAAFRGSAAVEELASVPPLYNDPALMRFVSSAAEELLGRQQVKNPNQGVMGSEDFAAFTDKIPCAYLILGVGSEAENPLYGRPLHNPHVVFNEDALPIGAALYAWSAMQWLAAGPQR